MKIVADSSALVAMILEEAEADAFYMAVSNASTVVVSAFTCYEAGVVLMTRSGAEVASRLLAFLDHGDFTVHPFTEESLLIALDAYRRYGKGMGSRPHLNLGDCVSYALAKSLGVPLLFKGDDFPATDVIPAL